LSLGANLVGLIVKPVDEPSIHTCPLGLELIIEALDLQRKSLSAGRQELDHVAHLRPARILAIFSFAAAALDGPSYFRIAAR